MNLNVIGCQCAHEAFMERHVQSGVATVSALTASHTASVIATEHVQRRLASLDGQDATAPLVSIFSRTLL